MLSIIGIIVLAGTAILAFLGGRAIRKENLEDRESVDHIAWFAISGAAGVGALVWLALAATVIVGAAEVGVPITFGRAGQPLSSGFHVKAPWTAVESFPIRPFGVPDVEITARTAQAGQVKAVVGARWHVDPARARDTYLQVRTGDEDRITKEVVDKALGQATGNVFVTRDNLTATTDRRGVEEALLVEVNRLVAPFGVVADNVFVRAVEPDGKTADALARVAAQQRETEIAVESQGTAREQAKARFLEAEGLKAAAGQVPAMSEQQVTALCLQAWERMAAKAIAAGVPLYTAPCGGSGVVIPAK